MALAEIQDYLKLMPMVKKAPQGYMWVSYKTEQFCREILSWHKSVYTVNHASNGKLITLGARPLTPGEEAKITLRSLEQS